MDHSVILQYVQALGFPICSSMALGWALWKIGGKLLEKFFQHVDAIAPKLERIAESNDQIKVNSEQIKEHTAKWPSDLVNKLSESVQAKIEEALEIKLRDLGCALNDSEKRTLLEALGRKSR